MLVNYSTDFNTAQHVVSFDRKRKDNAISGSYVLILMCVHFMNYSYQLTNIFNSFITQTFTVNTNAKQKYLGYKKGRGQSEAI